LLAEFVNLQVPPVFYSLQMSCRLKEVQACLQVHLLLALLPFSLVTAKQALSYPV
jgi:hypothetical protein